MSQPQVLCDQQLTLRTGNGGWLRLAWSKTKLWYGRLLLSTLLISAPSQAEPPTWQLVTEHFPPFNYQQQGNLTGFSTELLKRMMEDNQLAYQIALYPWARAYQIVLDSPHTLIYSIGRTKEREDAFYWVGPLANVDVYLWQSVDAPPLDLKDPMQFKRARLAFIRKSAIEKRLLSDKRFNKENNYPVTEIEDALMMLAHRRVDGVLMAINMEEEKAQLLKHLADKIERRQKVLTLPLYAALNKASGRQTAELLQQSLYQLRAKGDYQQLLDEYGLGDELVNLPVPALTEQ
ncbi:substrate-binding periplasmic protein [Bowmanella yangjiangensis]|uniref:Transporter substrate-binding domain-containing protein n=1 Tax=Bowmanella yangjiangensis TaxID=2811230 RepID=A0ABS3CRG7_9ALTE|nr:transporter substrate-binding domain-containing protein [Bowmanella yangjiangensis]MBN7818761.1 transporter substrate-binding domain-containing protein [Bowmanella yangjiangensis]